MAVCPQCGRPIAVARPSCLYCGAAVDPTLLPTPAPEKPPDLGPRDGVSRAVVVLDLEGASATRAAEALALTAFEAVQRVRRGGWQLHRISEEGSAQAEGDRLRADGFATFVIPVSELNVEPTLATGGRGHERGLTLRTPGGTIEVAGGDLLLLMTGTIHREVNDETRARHPLSRRRHSTLRFHFHLRGDGRPVELDPDTFAFEDAAIVPSSSLLELRSWMAALSPAPVLDDGFEDLPPVLSPELPRAPGMLDALRRGPRGDGITMLDNLRQFRFYSAWRGAVARRLARR